MKTKILTALALAAALSGCAGMTGGYDDIYAYEYVDGYTVGCDVARGNQKHESKYFPIYQEGYDKGYSDCCNGRTRCTHANADLKAGRPIKEPLWGPSIADKTPVIIMPSRTGQSSSSGYETW